MIKLIATCILFILLYFSFSILGEFDSKITLTIYDYYIETSLFTFIIFCIITLIISIFFINILSQVIDFPWKLKNYWIKKNDNNHYYHLVKSMSEYIIGNKINSNKLAHKIQHNLKPEYSEFSFLILGLTEENDDQKIQYFQKLEDSRLYSFFSLKKLSQIYLKQGLYNQAITYASKAFNLNEFDNEILETLIECYGKLAQWRQFSFVVAKLQKLDPIKTDLLKVKISEYYLVAAKEMQESGNKSEAANYLELSREFDQIV